MSWKPPLHRGCQLDEIGSPYSAEAFSIGIDQQPAWPLASHHPPRFTGLRYPLDDAGAAGSFPLGHEPAQTCSGRAGGHTLTGLGCTGVIAVLVLGVAIGPLLAMRNPAEADKLTPGADPAGESSKEPDASESSIESPTPRHTEDQP